MIYAHDLQFYISKFDGSADGEALTDFAVVAGSTVDKLINTGLTEADDYFNDSIVHMSTGEYSHVENSDQSGTYLDLFRSLSATPAGTFNVIPVGTAANSNYRSSERIPGLVSTSFMAGIDSYYVAHINGTGQAYLSWDEGLSEMSFKAPGDTVYGAGVEISGDGTYYIYGQPSSSGSVDKYIEITVTDLSLPAVDTIDSLTITRTEAVTLPNTAGEQSAVGIVRYILLPFKNNSSTDIARRVSASPSLAVVADSNVDGAWDNSITPFDIDDATGFPTASFWVLNETTDDCAYIRYRSGNTLYPSARTGVLRGKTASAWADDDVIRTWSDVDIALAAPVADLFPADLSSLSFTSGDENLVIGNMAIGDIYGVCVRETVLDTVYPIDNLLSQVDLAWL